MYIVNESNGSVEVSLILSGLASVDIPVRIYHSEGSATSKASIMYAYQCCDMTISI